jgi:hypothetical protein
MEAGAIEQTASALCPNIERSNFKEIIQIHAIDSIESQCLNLIAVTSAGVRLYFSCYHGQFVSLSLLHTLMSVSFGIAHYLTPMLYQKNMVNESTSASSGGGIHRQSINDQTRSEILLTLRQTQARPSTLRLMHVRLPPGFTANVNVPRPRNVIVAGVHTGRYFDSFCVPSTIFQILGSWLLH